MHEVRAASLTSYIEVARFAGLDPYAMLRGVGISPEFLENPENRCDARPVVDLIENSAHKSGCDTFGLMMAECRTFASLGPLSLLLQHLPTVRDVILTVVDMRRHLNEVLDCAIQDRDGKTMIRVEPLAEYAKPQIIELSVAMTYIVLRGASADQWQASSIHFMRVEPNDLAPVQRLFSIPVEYRSSFNGITTTPEAMAIRNPQANEALADHARRLLSLVDLHPEHGVIRDRARRAITLLLPSGRATLDNVAFNLGLTPRALQRGLEKEGDSFAELLNGIKRDLVLRYLGDLARPVGSVAGLVGYSSQSAFGRWFASEFGSSPNGWRLASADDGSTSSR